MIVVVLWFKLESKHEAASAYVDAAHCYKKTNMNGMYPSNLLSNADICLKFLPCCWYPMYIESLVAYISRILNIFMLAMFFYLFMNYDYCYE